MNEVATYAGPVTVAMWPHWQLESFVRTLVMFHEPEFIAVTMQASVPADEAKTA